MVLASFQTVSESFQDFSNIFMHNEFSLLSVFPVEYLLAAAEAARVEEKYWRVSKPALSLLFLGAGSEQACWGAHDRMGQAATGNTCCSVTLQSPLPKTPFFIWIARLLGACRDMHVAEGGLGEVE